MFVIWAQWLQSTLPDTNESLAVTCIIMHSVSFLPSKYHHRNLVDSKDYCIVICLHYLWLFIVNLWCNACESRHSTCSKKKSQIDFLSQMTTNFNFCETFQWLFNVPFTMRKKQVCCYTFLHVIFFREVCSIISHSSTKQ